MPAALHWQPLRFWAVFPCAASYSRDIYRARQMCVRYNTDGAVDWSPWYLPICSTVQALFDEMSIGIRVVPRKTETLAAGFKRTISKLQRGVCT